MEGFEVRTADDDKLGRVVGTRGEYVIVEQGALLKSKHAVPRELATVEEDDHVVRLTVSKEVFADSPKVGDDFDEREVARYYGLGAGYEAPETEGYGKLLPDDPAVGAEVQGLREDVGSPVQERVQTRQSLGPETADETLRNVPGAQLPTGGARD